MNSTRRRHAGIARGVILLGAILGLAWGSRLRWMAVIAGQMTDWIVSGANELYTIEQE
jgi:hypothetical protein